MDAKLCRVYLVAGWDRRELEVLVEVGGERDEIAAQRRVRLGVREEDNLGRERVVLHERLHQPRLGQRHGEVGDGLPDPRRERLGVVHVTIVRVRVGVLLVGAVRKQHRRHALLVVLGSLPGFGLIVRREKRFGRVPLREFRPLRRGRVHLHQGHASVDALDRGRREPPRDVHARPVAQLGERDDGDGRSFEHELLEPSRGHRREERSVVVAR